MSAAEPFHGAGAPCGQRSGWIGKMSGHEAASVGVHQ